MVTTLKFLALGTLPLTINAILKNKVEVGGGIGMGNTCKSMADSFQCMTKPTTIL